MNSVPRITRHRAHAKTTAFILTLALGIAGPAFSVESELGELLAWPVTASLRGYQKAVSPAKGTRCPMMPSDSAYARQALRRYGVFKGVALAADRVHRCGHDLSRYPAISTSEGMRFYDPLGREYEGRP